MADEYLLPLADDEKAASVALLKRVVDEDRYPFSPRICTLRGILSKLEVLPPKNASTTSVHGAGGRAVDLRRRAAVTTQFTQVERGYPQ